jgi:hypothetical protein
LQQARRSVLQHGMQGPCIPYQVLSDRVGSIQGRSGAPEHCSWGALTTQRTPCKQSLRPGTRNQAQSQQPGARGERAPRAAGLAAGEEAPTRRCGPAPQPAPHRHRSRRRARRLARRRLLGPRCGAAPPAGAPACLSWVGRSNEQVLRGVGQGVEPR